jgi:tryptophanyl-tRNA synthetase
VPAGQFKNAAPSGARSAGQSATSENPAHYPTLPIVTRMGRDYRPGPRQRIERVAQRAAHNKAICQTLTDKTVAKVTGRHYNLSRCIRPCQGSHGVWGLRAKSMIGISGCRLADGRLHFGHLLGCFSSPEAKTLQSFIFVIQDTAADRATDISYEARLIRLVSSVEAALQVPNLLICRQTTMTRHYAPLLDLLSEITPMRLLEDSNPSRETWTQRTGLVTSQAIFPLHQVSQILGLGADFVYMNDDNLRFVHLAKRLRKRVLARIPDKTIVRPELRTGPLPRLYGYNYERMSKGSGNAIYLDLEDSEIELEIQKLASRKWLIKQGAKYRISLRDSDKTTEVPENQPLLVFHSAFVAKQKQTCSPTDLEPSFLSESTEFAKTMCNRIRQSTLNITNDDKNVMDRLNKYEHIVGDIFDDNIARILGI